MTMINPGDLGAEKLRTSLTELIQESQALRKDVKTDAASRRRENMINLCVSALVLLLIGLLGAVAWQNQVIGRDSARTAAQIADCTTAGGKCFEEGRKRTGAAVGDISRVQLYIVECSRALPVAQYPPGPVFDAEFEKCVGARLAAAKKTAPGK